MGSDSDFVNLELTIRLAMEKIIETPTNN
ncbi:uncharacterized protein G2W53_013921 [Senna tora]|uniref:Uncharacterized protein n=1 Tax=Senna tora TaxID=362788 RepID=A0A834WRH3_9FABA|nr:uncharacterized protein G2W53_013921 [Senna tora]